MKRTVIYKLVLGGVVILLAFYYWSLPARLFHDPSSTVLEDARGELLSASIARDGQWRFPEMDSVPLKFSAALLLYEDKRFESHPGVDPLSLARAFKQNIQHGKIISGGSTLTMQVVRLSRRGKPRTIFQKFIEIVLATRVELRYSKDKILALYASHAPFGGNVVGLEAACWRYFGRSPFSLSWGEAALLAVLPNSPSLMHPGKNRDRLKIKRDLLLDRLQIAGAIDAMTCSLSKAEPLPDKPQPLPQYAQHLLMRCSNEGFAEQRIQTSVVRTLQSNVAQIIDDHYQRLKGNEIYNAAALVVEVSTGNVLAYVGNTNVKEKGNHGEAVDIITAPRSTGSILKPFLYAAMLDEGKILASTLLPDIPTVINGFAPKNFSRDYDGVVPANDALIRSLNIPAVHMLRSYRYEKFHSLLRATGMTTLTYPPDHYGLSLILGGAEGTLWDITGMYASMARTLTNYFRFPGKDRYNRNDFHPLKYTWNNDREADEQSLVGLDETSLFSAAAIYQTFDALKELYRPGEESAWRYFSSSRKIAWKTGTSFGLRDGWAVGVTPDYVVGVWVGNANGTGRPGLTGTETAAPILFDIFSLLGGHAWFQKPSSEMVTITVCAISGQRNTPQCEDVDTVMVNRKGLESGLCAFHRVIHLSLDGKFQVNSSCERVDQIRNVNWFVLPPIQEYYYRTKNLTYAPLPPYRSDCGKASQLIPMELIYPKSNASIFIPRDLDGEWGNAIFQLAHRDPKATVHWHLDGVYLGSTKKNHQLAVNPKQGKHTLVLVDENGESLEEHFEVLSKM